MTRETIFSRLSELTKKEIREAVGARRLSYPDIQADSLAICRRLSELPEFRESNVILSYYPLPGEVDLRSLFSGFTDKTFVLPLVEGNGLVLKKYDPLRMHKGYHGILEPDSEVRTFLPEEIDLALVPAVAYSSDGMRLGRGGGFYDRLLPQLRCPLIGVAFAFQIFGTIPSEEWDMPVNKVIIP